MVILILAILVSTGLSVYVSFSIEDFGGVGDIFAIITFYLFSIYAFFEILKWPLGKRKIDNSGRLKSHLFGDAKDTWWWLIFPRESIISAKTKKEVQVVWFNFLYSMFFMGLILWQLYFE